MPRFAVLNNGVVTEEKDLLEWARKFEYCDRRVKESDIQDAYISTVFLGMDHGFMGSKPLWFETMVFGGFYHGEVHRYETIDEAREGHERMVQQILGKKT